MSYYNEQDNENLLKNQQGKIGVILRIPKFGTPPNSPYSEFMTKTHAEIRYRAFSVYPRTFYDAISYITYPGIMPYEYLINTRGFIFEANTGKVHDMYSDLYYTTRLLTNAGGFIKLYVHRLVAYQFCNPPYNFQNMVVNHINGDKHCNFANNLEWIQLAANNQHSMILHSKQNTKIINGRPLVDENFVRFLCEQFIDGKSNTEIMKDLGMEINNANHTLLRDIREGYTWKNITCQYDFPKYSKKHAYTKEEKDQIKQYMMQNKTNKEIFKLMQGRDYVASTDRLDSSYRTIQSIRASSWYSTYLYKLSHNML